MLPNKVNIQKFNLLVEIKANRLIQDACIFQQFLKENIDINKKYTQFKEEYYSNVKLKKNEDERKQTRKAIGFRASCK